jgi:hypothetical protein
MSRVTIKGNDSLLISGCIASYPHLWEPHAAAVGSVPKYSISLILPADMADTDWTALNGMIEYQKQVQWPNGAPVACRWPVVPVDPEKVSGFEGRFRLGASSAAYTRKHPYGPGVPPLAGPQVVDENRNPAIPGDLYAGCGVNAYLQCKAYTMGSNGVTFYIRMIQIANRGLPRIDGRLAPDEVFGIEEVSMEAAMPQQAPLAPITPAPHQPAPQAQPAWYPPGASQAPQAPVTAPQVAAAPVAAPQQPGPAQAVPGVPPGAPQTPQQPGPAQAVPGVPPGAPQTPQQSGPVPGMGPLLS